MCTPLSTLRGSVQGASRQRQGGLLPCLRVVPVRGGQLLLQGDLLLAHTPAAPRQPWPARAGGPRSHSGVREDCPPSGALQERLQLHEGGLPHDSTLIRQGVAGTNTDVLALQQQRGGSVSLWLCFLCCSWPILALSGAFKLCGDLVGFIGPMAISVLVSYVQREGSSKGTSLGAGAEVGRRLLLLPHD